MAVEHAIEIVETIISLAIAGHSRGVIADQMGMTRSAVSGVLFRQGIKAPKPKPAPKPRRTAPNTLPRAVGSAEDRFVYTEDVGGWIPSPSVRGPTSWNLRAPVFHFTDTINLPWILASGELRPCWIVDAGIGRNRFLWGTTNPLGDYTSGAQSRIHGSMEREWQAGVFHLVRFTLAADEFFTWSEIVRASNWTPEEVATLIESDHRLYGEYGHKRWRLRQDPVPLSRVLKVETTSYDDAETERWWPLNIGARGVLLRPKDPKRKGVRVGSRRFYSIPVQQDLQIYLPWTPLYETYEDALADARYANQPDQDDD